MTQTSKLRRYSHTLKSSTAQFFNRIRRDLRGESAAIFAAAMVPTVAATGAAVDISRAYYARSQLQAAVDAATVAGAKFFYQESRDSEIERYFHANFPEGHMGTNDTELTITPESVPDRDTSREQKLTITARAEIPSMFMQVFGVDTVPVSAYAEAARRETGLEVVLVLDNTGSMATNDAGGGQTRIASSTFSMGRHLQMEPTQICAWVSSLIRTRSTWVD
jgi:Flp pilus assembly protein TadG